MGWSGWHPEPEITKTLIRVLVPGQPCKRCVAWMRVALSCSRRDELRDRPLYGIKRAEPVGMLLGGFPDGDARPCMRCACRYSWRDLMSALPTESGALRP
jgi:hypothetical protein